MNTTKSIHEQLRNAGVPLDHHESDLYAKVTPESRSIVAAYKFRSNVTCFSASDGSGTWYDIPFAYDPFWRGADAPAASEVRS